MLVHFYYILFKYFNVVKVGLQTIITAKKISLIFFQRRPAPTSGTSSQIITKSADFATTYTQAAARARHFVTRRMEWNFMEENFASNYTAYALERKPVSSFQVPIYVPFNPYLPLV